jgi:ATP-dependent Clp protease ATP-binding subunit ClpA
MRRLIQDAIEEKIAEKIIAGGLKQGDTIGFTARDVGA